MQLWTCLLDLDGHPAEVTLWHTEQAALGRAVAKMLYKHKPNDDTYDNLNHALADGDLAAVRTLLDRIVEKTTDTFSVVSHEIPSSALVTISGGVADLVQCDAGLEVNILDYDDLKESLKEARPALVLTDAELQYIRTHDGPLFIQEVEDGVQRGEAMAQNCGLSKCQNCQRIWADTNLMQDIRDLRQRVSAGEPMPSGECPDAECGAPCQPLGKGE